MDKVRLVTKDKEDIERVIGAIECVAHNIQGVIAVLLLVLLLVAIGG